VAGREATSGGHHKKEAMVTPFCSSGISGTHRKERAAATLLAVLRAAGAVAACTEELGVRSRPPTVKTFGRK
jgi:hypothetical protein